MDDLFLQEIMSIINSYVEDVDLASEIADELYSYLVNGDYLR
jgi:hypothetical protein